MKAIMISIKPKWCAKIMNGEKTIEVRKNKALADAIQKLIDENGYTDIYVYCTKCDIKGARENFTFEQLKLLGKVAFKFRCYKVEEITPQIWTPQIELKILEKSRLKEHELFDYVCSHDGTEDRPFYAIHISDLEIFDKPKELNEFNHWTDKKIQWYSVGEKVKVMVSLTNAPQNYCYVEIGK